MTAATLMNLENRYERTNILSFHLYKVLRIVKIKETKHRSYQRLESGRWQGELLFNGYRVSVWSDEKVLEIDSCDDYTTL